MYFWKTLACEQQTYFRSSLLSLLVMVVKFTFQSVYLVTLAKIQDTPAGEVASSHSSCILSFELIGQHQNKRFHVTEIVLPLGFADVIFRRERSDDRKYVCCSQARKRSAWLSV